MANLSNINNILRISSSGVGLNKDNTGPSELDIESAGADMIDMTRTGLKTYRLAVSGTSAFSVFDVAANADRLTILTGGNVGIGTSLPAKKLDVARAAAYFDGASTDEGAVIRLTNPSQWESGYDGNGFLGGIEFYSGDDSENGPAVFGAIKQRMLTPYNDTAMCFFTSPSNGSLTERMRIDSSGNVGIGTDSPLVRLQLDRTVSAATSRTAPVNLMYLTSEHPSVGYTGFGTAITHYSKTYQNSTKTEQSKIAFTQQGDSVSTAGSTIDFYTKTLSTGSAAPELRMRISYTGDTTLKGNLIINKFSTTSPYANGEIRFTGRYDRYVGGIKTFTDNASYPEYANGLDFFVQRHVYALPNGHLAMRIDSEGNVGIGTDSPLKPLHVFASNGAGNIRLTRSGTSEYHDIGTYYSYTNGNSADFGTTSVHKTFLTTASYNALEINPQQEVSLLGYRGADGFALPQDQNTGYSNFSAGGFGILFRETRDNYILGNAYYYKTGGTAGWRAKYSAYGATLISSDGDLMQFQNAPAVAGGSNLTFTPRLNIIANGNVGIGTTGPATKLTVKGATQFGGNSTSTAALTSEFSAYGSTQNLYNITLQEGAVWSPGIAVINFAASRSGLQKHYAGQIIVRLTYYNGSGVAGQGGWAAPSAVGAVISYSGEAETYMRVYVNGSNTGNPMTIQIGVRDIDDTTNYFVSDIRVTLRSGALTITS